MDQRFERLGVRDHPHDILAVGVYQPVARSGLRRFSQKNRFAVDFGSMLRHILHRNHGNSIDFIDRQIANQQGAAFGAFRDRDSEIADLHVVRGRRCDDRLAQRYARRHQRQGPTMLMRRDSFERNLASHTVQAVHGQFDEPEMAWVYGSEPGQRIFPLAVHDLGGQNQVGCGAQRRFQAGIFDRIARIVQDHIDRDKLRLRLGNLVEGRGENLPARAGTAHRFEGFLVDADHHRLRLPIRFMP